MTDEAALDALLEREPNNIAALVLKGQLRQQSRDDRAASAFYQAALRAAAAAQSLPASLRPVIERAQAGFAQCQASFDRHTEQALSAAGFPLGRRPPRFQESIDLMRGVRQTQLQLQRPDCLLFSRPSAAPLLRARRSSVGGADRGSDLNNQGRTPRLSGEERRRLFPVYGHRSDAASERISRPGRQSGLEHALHLFQRRPGP